MSLRQRLFALCAKGSKPSSWHRRLAFSGRGAIQHLGAIGVAALGILALCSAIWMTTLADLQEQADLLDVQRLSKQMAAAPDLKPSREQIAELDLFRGVLADQSRLATLIGQLHGLADGSGLRLTASEFAVPNIGDAKTSSMPAIVVTLESNAGHDAIVRFINSVLTNMPNAALEAISMSRVRLADPVWETHMRFRFYVKTT